MTDTPKPRRDLWDERHAARDPIESHAPDPSLMAAVADLTPGRALDLATGDGRNAIWLAERGWDVTAVDFSTVALERAGAAARRAGVHVDWVLADLTSWRPNPDSFDLVAVVFLHLPVEQRRGVYGAAAAAVAPGGHLVIIGHDRSNLTEGTGGPQDPDVLFTSSEIASVLEGFEVLRAERVSRDVGDGRRAIDAVVTGVRRQP